MDTWEENTPKQINQEVLQPVRISTRHATPSHLLEPTIRGKTYQTKNLITKTAEANEYTIDYITEEAIVLGQILSQTYNLTE